MRALVLGWFSYSIGTSTIGDVAAASTVVDVLSELGYKPQVWASPYSGFDLSWVDGPNGHYDVAVWVCGPLAGSSPFEKLDHIDADQFLAVGVSDVGNEALHQRFERILWRDSGEERECDIAFGARLPSRPVVGVVLAGPQHEYPSDLHHDVEEAIDSCLRAVGAARMNIDTKLPANGFGQVDPEAVLRQIASVDAVVTTRLHGVVMAIRTGAPVIAIDQVPGGAKVTAQCKALGVPVYSPDQLTPSLLVGIVRQSAPLPQLGITGTVRTRLREWFANEV